LATGLITAADADAIRPASNATINNYGRIISNIGTAANGNDSGNDAIDFQNFSGTVNNYAGGVISSARHGITGNFGINVTNAGTIIGNDGSCINIDSTTNASVTNVTNRCTIIGTAKTADGDGIDVDRLLNLENYGTVKASASVAAAVSPKASPSAAAPSTTTRVHSYTARSAPSPSTTAAWAMPSLP
jgi:hypothetical protein